MRAAAILGLGCSAKNLKPFQIDASVEWRIGMPAAADEVDIILLFGGDGTIHRHLGRLVTLGLPVLVVPCGSGNDFARALGLRSVRDALAAWKKFVSSSGNVRSVDLGAIVALSGPAPREHYFCCVGGVGLDAEVARRASRLPRWLRARGGYILSLLPALLRFEPISMNL